MLKRYTLSLTTAACLLAIVGSSQTFSIKGKVVTTAGSAVPLAYVSVLNGADSTMIQTGQTNDNGVFDYQDIKPGKYIIDVQALGYHNSKQQVQVSADTTLPDIVVKSKDNRMEEVVVAAKKDIITTELGKTIVHVRDAAKQGSTLLDILRTMPGMSVGADGTISMDGKDGLLVLVDDKPTYLNGRELTEYLKSVNASEVNNVELMTQPSAKYEAEGNAGIINIKMNKHKQEGWKGTASAHYEQGVYPFIGANSNISYRKNKATYFINPGYYKGQGFLKSTKETQAKQDGETVAVITEEAFKKEQFPDYSLKTGVDYDVTDKTTLAASAKGIYHTNTEVDKTQSVITGVSNGSTIYNNTENRNGHIRSHIELDAFLKHEIDSNSNVQVNAAGFFNRRDIYQQLNSANYDENGEPLPEPLILDNKIPDRTNLYVLKADYTGKIADNVKVECGVKSNYTTLDEANLFDRYTNNTWVTDTIRSNKFLYKEYINAAYVSSSTSINKLQLQGGLRVEHTHAEGNQVTQNKQFVLDYLSLFPTAYANYKIDKNHTLEANYSRRLRRPNYRDLNPFAMYTSQYSIFTGNPLLQPQFTHNAELKHNFKGRFITVANWSKTMGTFIEQLVFDNSTNVSTSFYANGGRNSRLSLSGHYTNQVNKWLHLGIMAAGHYAEFEADYNGQHHYATWAGMYASIDTQLSFKNGWSASAHSRCAGPYRTSVVQHTNGSVWVNASVSKSMMKDTASVRISLEDPFRWYRHAYIIDQPNARAASSSMYNTQSVSLAFTYNFGKRDELRRRDDIAEEGRRM